MFRYAFVEILVYLVLHLVRVGFDIGKRLDVDRTYSVEILYVRRQGHQHGVDLRVMGAVQVDKPDILEPLFVGFLYVLLVVIAFV